MVAWLLIAFAPHGNTEEAKNAPAIAFGTHIAPILDQHCYKCHGPEKRKGGLRLSNEKDVRLGGDDGHSPFAKGEDGLIPLLQRITSDDEDFQMPPKGPRVPQEDIDTLRAWIGGGASWNTDAAAKTGAPKELFWSFKAPEHRNPPKVDGGNNAIDGFIQEVMQRQGLIPSPVADRNTLIRRLSLDLRGLPPTPEEVNTFVTDTRPDAYEALVEKFLASPHYGERQAVSWLDVARYADTNGYEKDRPRSIWPYRDWVINAFNADMPFDRFIIEQIAGDLLPSPTLEQRIATGFHRNVMLNEEGGIDVEEFRYKNVVDRTNTTATALLGLTFSCAQCHTHKYDPITQREFYQFFAFFNNTDDVTLDVPDADIAQRQAEHQARITALRASLHEKFPADDPTQKLDSLIPAEARATQGGVLSVAPDGIVDVSPASPEKNTYITKLTLPAGRVDGLVLHVPNGEKGPGRAPGGNFVLSEFVGYRLDGDTRTSLIFEKAETEFSQANFPIGNTIDGKMNTGWAIAGDPGGLKRDRRAVFYFADALELAAPQTIEVRLEQQHGSQHTLGNFRLEALALAVPDSDVPEAERRKEFFAEQYAAWSAETKVKCQPWQPLTPLEMSAKKLTTLVRLADNSILAKGNLPNNDIYDLTLRTDARNITGIRLEVLPHESLPGGGPGRGVILGEGDFLLTGIRISAAPWDNPEARVPVAINHATESFANGNKTATQALDGKADTGWSIHGGEGKGHSAVFAFETPVNFPGGTIFSVTLEQKYIHQHTLGRFRLSVTNGAAPEVSGVPADVESMLLADFQTSSVQSALEDYFLAHTPLLAKPHEEIAALEKSRPKPPTTLALEEREAVRTAHVHHRGEFLSTRAAVQPDVLEVLPPLPEFAPRNRLTLAKWLVSEENPLTARVTMNRLWQQLFGRGIVATTEDFGIMGETPTHPELLDWLAVEFMRRGWGMKDMVRLMVTSATYRQSARITPEQQAIDPTNVYLARAPRFRVDAEMVRDIALASSGSLDTTVGGPSVFPPIPDGLMQFVYGGFKWNTDTGQNRYRRGMYTYWKRMLPYPAASVFDAPARDMVCVRRIRTNTPMQALTLLNDEVFMEAARSMATALLAETQPDPASRIHALFMRCLSRGPDAMEQKALLAYLDEQRSLLAAQNPEALMALLKVGEDESNEILVERAAWTLLCRAVLNLDETITRG
jgi:mono/diheme cytochrome c family protein